MQRLLTFGILGSFLVLSLPACRKNHDAHQTPPGKTATVYVLGTTSQSTAYWVNGVETPLQNPSGVIYAPSMAVSDSTVYVGGALTTGPNKGNAEIWTNGTGAALPDSGVGFGSAIFVSGGDVYLAGNSSYFAPSTVPYTTPTAPYPFAGNVATYWKNGVASTLPSVPLVGYQQGYGLDDHDDYVSSMFVSGSDVYVAGGSHGYQEGNPASYQFAGYWKNGTLVNLSAGLIDTTQETAPNFLVAYPNTTSIYVSGNDVYVAGIEYGQFGNQALYWKDGVASYLQSDGALFTTANGIFVSGSDVYVAGSATINGKLSAICWKNGVPSTLSSANGNSGANAVCVLDTNVYVAGYEVNNDTAYVTYWMNGVPVHLATNGEANAIYVK